MASRVQNILEVEKILNYTFNDQSKCIEALQTYGSPYSRAGIPGPVVKQDRLKLLGEVVLSLVLCHSWYQTSSAPGVWDSIRNTTIANRAMADHGRTLGLAPHIILNPGSYHATDNLVASTLKALLGAVYEDCAEDTRLATVTRTIQQLGLMPAELAGVNTRAEALLAIKPAAVGV